MKRRDEIDLERILELEVERNRLKEENEELSRLFVMRHAADMRAIAMWREGHPERELRQPDHADLVVFLLNLLEGGFK